MQNANVKRRYCTVKEACNEMHISRNTLSRLAVDAEALVRIGTRGIRVDMDKLYTYMDAVNTVTEK